MEAPRPADVHTIDDVMDALGAIADVARVEGARFGLFAALYLRTTAAVRTALRAGAFEDGGWVERLDVVFARRYLEAFAADREGRRPTAAWAHAFARGRESGHLALQHLLLGMSAHILLDLGVATDDVRDGPLPARRADFLAINRVLAEMLDDVQEDLGRVSPAMAWIDRAGGRWDERAATAALRRWRATAWRRAVGLSQSPAAERPALVERIDAATVRVARGLCPAAGSLAGSAAMCLSGWIRRREDEDVGSLIDAIEGRR